MKIRPVTDLRNRFPEVESEVREEGAVYLTKNGYASAVLLSVEEYESLVGSDSASIDSSRKDGACNRGFLHRYADPDLIPLEKEAGRLHALANRNKYIAEGADV